MASSGPNSPSTTATDSGSGGTVDWTNHANAKAQDDSYANANLIITATTSYYLKATDFGFSIPSTATIDGIVVEVDRYRYTPTSGECNDHRVRIIKGGSIGSTDKAVGTNWPGTDTDTYQSYGGSTDKWGETWSYSDINSSNFGVAVSAQRVSGIADARIDHIRITVHYTDGGGGGDAQPMAMTQTRFRRV